MDFIEELLGSLRLRSKRPLFVVVRMPYSEQPAPQHSEDEICWCSPVIVPLGEPGTYVIHHRRFEH